MSLEVTERYFTVSGEGEIISDDRQRFAPALAKVRFENRQWTSVLVFGVVPEDGSGTLATYYRGAGQPPPDFVRPFLLFDRERHLAA